MGKTEGDNLIKCKINSENSKKKEQELEAKSNSKNYRKDGRKKKVEERHLRRTTDVKFLNNQLRRETDKARKKW